MTPKTSPTQRSVAGKGPTPDLHGNPQARRALPADANRGSHEAPKQVGRALPAEPNRVSHGADKQHRGRPPFTPVPDAKPQGSRSEVKAHRPGASNTGRKQKALQAHRRRQVCVSAILNRLFKPLGRSDPDLWDRRAYLLIVGMVYERLAVNEAEIPTDELIALAKTLAEARRVEVKRREHSVPEDGSDAPAEHDSAERLDDLVREIYGANLHPPSPTPEEPKGV